MSAELEIRETRAEDQEQVFALMASSLGWVDDERHRRLFAWKHHENPFGESPSWVAVDGDRVVGFRAFLRWEFVRDGRVFRAVRAVDTATDPAYRGQGIFKRLTLHGLEQLQSEGVDFVFNTPNDQSRPGYLKMGWEELGRVPVSVGPASPLGVLRLLRSRVPAELWSEPATFGEPVRGGDLAEDEVAVDGFATRRTAAYYDWRYGLEPLHYRCISDGRGHLVVRLRRRGPSTELTICEQIGDVTPSLRRRTLRPSGADYAIATRDLPIRLPDLGPILTWRALASTDVPSREEFHLTLGDIELF